MRFAEMAVAISERVEPLKENKRVAMICNMASKTPTSSDYAKDSIITEYLDDDEYEEILNMFDKAGWLVETFLHEDTFLQWVYDNSHNGILVYNSAQSGTGPGRKSLIPAFCNLHCIPVTGSNPYVVSLCRNKFHVNCILSNRNIPVPKSWLYSNGEWLQGYSPDIGNKLICKPIYESACIGIDETSIIEYDLRSNEYIAQKSIDFGQPILVQSFIPGYEVSIPVIVDNGCVTVGLPIGIDIGSCQNLGMSILTYDIVLNEKYGFYDYGSMFPSDVKKIEKAVELTTQILGINGLGRIDMRIQKGELYITDVATNPHFVRHSACHYLFDLLGLEEQVIPDILMGTISSSKLF